MANHKEGLAITGTSKSKIFPYNVQDQEELANEFLNSLENIINKSSDLVALNSLQSNWKNHQFYTKNSERAAIIDQFYSNRQKEITKKRFFLAFSTKKSFNQCLTNYISYLFRNCYFRNIYPATKKN